MKRIFVLAACLWLTTAGAASAGIFGPASPAGKAGNLSFGPGVMGYAGEYEDDAEFDQTQAYLQLGYALTDNFEIYLQGGAADLSVDEVDFEDGFRPFGSVGVKALLADRKPIALGVFAQGSYFSDYEDEDGAVKIEFTSNYDLAGGVVFQGVAEGATIYGGPFFFIRESDVDLEVAGVTVASDSVEEDGNFGMFLGIRWPLKNGLNIDLEGQYRTGFSIGGDILYNF
jgi:hypothetical protein